MSKHKKTLLIIIPIMIFLVSSIWYIELGLGVNTNAVITKNVTVSNEAVQISGTTVNSGEAFVGYSYKIKKNILYLNLRYSIVNPVHHSDDFNIRISDNLENVEKIYLQGNKTEDEKLVWIK